MIILGVESSCDELAMAILQDKIILARVVTSQVAQHQPFYGVVPEVASRLHMEYLTPTFRQVMAEAGITPAELQAVAFTNRPGLVGSLLVGLCFAKSLAWSLDLPFVGVDHVMAHWYVNHLVHPHLNFPYLAVVVSGGHTLLFHVQSLEQVDIVGRTIDDAIGECYDKVAKFHELGYPGGPVIDRLAQQGDPKAYRFPHANLYKGSHPYDVSYSGIKNAATNQYKQFHVAGHGQDIEDLCASFQTVAVGMLVSKIEKALKDFRLHQVVVGGGVSANRYLRSRLADLSRVQVFTPPLSLCGDNAEMIAYLGETLLQNGQGDDLTITAMNRIVPKGQ